jgi:23S rRNA (guanosine2251-2'-O)-methyltransferase
MKYSNKSTKSAQNNPRSSYKAPSKATQKPYRKTTPAGGAQTIKVKLKTTGTKSSNVTKSAKPLKEKILKERSHAFNTSNQDLSHLVMGRNTIREIAKHNPAILKKIYCTENLLAEHQEFRKIFSNLKIQVQMRTGAELTEFFASTSHQGIGAEIERANLISLKEIIQNKDYYKKILALDAIQDAHNLGAILRAAECFGIDAVLWSGNRSVKLSPVVSKVSMGGSELVPLCEIGNLGDALQKLKAAGFWTVLADLDEKAGKLAGFKFPENLCLVLGSEGQGAAKRIKDLCDESIYIEQYGQLQSLNVSQAAAVLLYTIAQATNATK